MAAPDRSRFRILSDIVASVTIGAMATFILALLGAAQILPATTELLLRPGSFLSRRFGANGVSSFALFFFGDAICYGFIPFVILRLRSSRKARAAAPPFDENSLIAKSAPGEMPYQIETVVEPQSMSPSAPVSETFSSYVERRRAPRLSVSAPVFVYGWDGNEPFSEVTETVDVSAVGGLMVLEANVAPAQELILINASSEAELPCRVARTLHMANGATAVALEFLQPAMSFWEAPASAASA